MKICMILGVLVTFLAIGGAADAGTLGSGSVQSDLFICSVVNLGANVIQSLTIQILNAQNGDSLATETCVALEPNTECFLRLDLTPDAARAFCRVDSTAAASQIRGSLLVSSGGIVVLDVR